MADTSEYRFVVVGANGKIDPSLIDLEGDGVPDELIDGNTGKIRKNLLPDGIAYTVFPGVLPDAMLPGNLVKTDPQTGKIAASVMPFGVSGFPRSVEWAFGGRLEIRTGLFFWRVPPFRSIVPRAFTATLGTLAQNTGGGPTTFVLNVNGVEVSRVSVPLSKMDAETITFAPIAATIPARSVISVDVIATGNTTPTLASGDATLQFWWEYAD